MKLNKILFNSFRSLINKELEIKHNCIGFVGLNESGKSNILEAIRILDDEYTFELSDKPKMPNSPLPEISYFFKLNDNEENEIKTVLEAWFKENTLVKLNDCIKSNQPIINQIELIVGMNTNNEKYRNYDIIYNINSDLYILKPDYIKKSYISLILNNENISINKALIIQEKNFKETEDIEKKIEKKNNIKDELNQFNLNIGEINKNEKSLIEELNSLEKAEDEQQKKTDSIMQIKEDLKNISKQKKGLERKIKNKENILKELSEDLSKYLIINEIDKSIKNQKNKEEELLSLKNQINETSDETEKNQINESVKKIEEEYKILKSKHIELTGNIREKYQQIDNNSFSNILDSLIINIILEKIPKVIFWEYDDKYLLPSGIPYDDFLKNDKPFLNSRPLYNIFFLADKLKINNIDDLKKKIAIWKKDSSEGLRDGQILIEAVNNYITEIWEEYDQEFSIHLDESRITIHINDPKSSHRSFYEMRQRSQGCRTFISFLLTIAAETHTKKIKDYILILDEPETHLHPSGVRFMRNELLKLADQGTYVFFATHSIFMIDRKCLDRHAIVKKEDEETKIKLAEERALTQEMVIYKEFGTSLSEFSIPQKNILFEGEADILLFEFYHEYCFDKRKQVFNDYILRDGDGTTTIKKFFKEKIIQKDSHWILILDKDRNGKELELYLKNDDIYKKSFNDMFSIVYYGDKDKTELEDLLPHKIIKEVILKTCNELDLNIEQELVLNNTEFIKSQIDKFKNLNKLKDELNKKFNKKFKGNLNQQIKEILISLQAISTTENKKNGTVNKRNEFQKVFPKYTEFITKLFDESEKIKK